MGTPYIAEIRIFPFNFAPNGWAQCDGQLMSITQNTALFSLIGTTYGGDGRVTFALPDLRGNVPVYVGQGIVQGARAGEEAHTLLQSEMAAHNHGVQASSTPANAFNPANNLLAASAPGTFLFYASSGGQTTLVPSTIASAGQSQPHANMQPYLVLNFCIALQGIFPSRN
jgi:microcystin-dependent protein